MAGPSKDELSPADVARLRKAMEGLEQATRSLGAARRRYAKVVRALGLSAVARELGTTKQALAQRLRTIEGTGRPNR